MDYSGGEWRVQLVSLSLCEEYAPDKLWGESITRIWSVAEVTGPSQKFVAGFCDASSKCVYRAELLLPAVHTATLHNVYDAELVT